MGLVSFLVSANEIAGSSGAASPAAASASASRRDTPFSEARDRRDWAAFGAVRSKFILGLLVRWIERHALASRIRRTRQKAPAASVGRPQNSWRALPDQTDAESSFH